MVQPPTCIGTILGTYPLCVMVIYFLIERTFPPQVKLHFDNVTRFLFQNVRKSTLSCDETTTRLTFERIYRTIIKRYH
jgi:hypothetical protein